MKKLVCAVSMLFFSGLTLADRHIQTSVEWRKGESGNQEYYIEVMKKNKDGKYESDGERCCYKNRGEAERAAEKIRKGEEEQRNL